MLHDAYAIGVVHAADVLGFEKRAGKMDAAKALLMAMGPGTLAGAGVGAGVGAASADEGNKLRAALLGALLGGGATAGMGAAGMGVARLGGKLGKPGAETAGHVMAGPAMGPSLGMSLATEGQGAVSNADMLKRLGLGIGAGSLPAAAVGTGAGLGAGALANRA